MDGAALGGLAVVLCCLLVCAFPFALLLWSVAMGFRRRRQTESLLAQAEPHLAGLLRSTTPPVGHRGPTALVHGSVAYAADYPSRWALGWVRLVGGRAESMSTQVDLARRLATVRMLEHAASLGAHGVTNVRIETSQIDMNAGAGMKGQSGATVIEMLAHGTALLPAKGVTAQ